MSRPNGWRGGHDPIQRWLRAVTAVACLVVFVWLAVDPARRDWPTLTIALGALLILLGYEAIVRLPWLGQSGNRPDYWADQPPEPPPPPGRTSRAPRGDNPPPPED
ncbi:MAG TPA: hypothetical protein VLM76_09315 [Patescibacteria group bacterium]|nr:hypothetical protein [Patescibacteria group bacterium]